MLDIQFGIRLRLLWHLVTAPCQGVAGKRSLKLGKRRLKPQVKHNLLQTTVLTRRRDKANEYPESRIENRV